MDRFIEQRLVAGFGLALLILLVIGAVSFGSTNALINTGHLVAHTQEVLAEAEATLSTVVDAETGQRGYLITGDESYLAPYNNGIARVNDQVAQLKELTRDNSAQQQRIVLLQAKIAARLQMLQEGVTLRRKQGFAAAQQLVVTGGGQQTMDDIRTLIGQIEDEERSLLTQRTAASEFDARNTLLALGVLTFLGLGLLVLVYFLIRHNFRNQERANAERLRITLASIGDAVLVTDRDGRVTFMNPVAETLTGWPQAEALGQDLPTVFHIVNEATRALVENPVSKVMRLGAVVGLANHTVIIAKDGSERPIDDSGAPIRDAAGVIIGVVLVFRDISERQRAEATQAELAAIVESSGDVIIGKSLEGIIRNWNQAAARLYGYSADEAIGRPINILAPPERADEIPQIMEQIKAGRPVEHLETVRMRKDGTRLDVSITVSPIRNAAGTITGASTIAHNISERKRAEQRLEYLAEASDVLASSLDYETTLASVARLTVPQIADWCTVHVVRGDGVVQQLAVAHVDPAKAAWAHELEQRYPPDPNAPTGVLQVIRTGHTEFYPSFPEELLIAGARDAEHLAIIQAIGFTAAIIAPLVVHDRVLGAITFVSAESGRHYTTADVTLAEDLARRAAVAIENAQLYQESQDAINIRDQFLSIAAHELRTPLTSLMGYTQLVQRRSSREGTLSTRDQQALQVVVDQATRLNHMIRTLLDLSRIKTGQLSIDPAPLDLCALVRQVVADVQPTLERHTVQIECPDLPLIVTGDALRLEQVVQNLVQNAIKYSPAGGPIIVRVEARADNTCISVSDQGIGIPEAALPHLFHQFYRAPNVDGQQISGMGVGLYVVNEIVALHSGRIDVTSKEGAGSTFTVCLPLPVAAESPTGVSP